MRFHRFYSPEKLEDTLNNTGDTLSHTYHAEQWRKVFRFKPGDSVIMFDGSGFDFLCEIKDFQGETALVSLISREKNIVVAKHDVILVAALVKKDTFEWIAQKATELGVSQIVPVIAERSEKKNINIERLQKIITEAAEQSGRATLPVLHEALELDVIIGNPEFFGESSLVWEPEAPLFDRESFFSKIFSTASDPKEKIIVYIGPEGGWSPKELELFREKRIAMYSMGPQVLRAETAVVAGVSLVIF